MELKKRIIAIATAAGLLIGGVAVLSTSNEPAFVERKQFGAKFEKTGVMFGGGFKDMTGYNSLKAAIGREPATYLCYTNMTMSISLFFNIDWAADIANIKKLPAGVIPIVNICMIEREDGNGRGIQTCKDYANTTKYDWCQNKIIADLKALNRPVFIAFGYEFNHRNMGYVGADFKKAYRKFVTAYRAAGANNIANVWTSAGIPSGRGIPDTWKTWYPGDDVVDWTGYNIYNLQDEVKNMETIYPRLPAFCDSATAHNKPVAIIESSAVAQYAVRKDSKGVLSDNAKVAIEQCLEPYFDFIYGLAAIKMVNWCHINWSIDNAGSGYKGDGQFGSLPETKNYVLKRLAGMPIVYGDGTKEPPKPKPDTVWVKVPYEVLVPKDTFKIQERTVYDTIRFTIKVPVILYKDSAVIKGF